MSGALGLVLRAASGGKALVVWKQIPLRWDRMQDVVAWPQEW